jgi:thiamine kinase-like enzyme
MIDFDAEENIVKILSQLRIESSSLTRLKKGRNSRVWKIFSNSIPLVVKEYGNGEDSILRLQREFSFLKYLKDIGIKNVPEPIKFNTENRIGIYSFLEGEEVDVIEDAHVIQCAKFIHQINDKYFLRKAKSLHNASEAFFCLEDHLKCVESRLKTLSHIKIESDIHRSAILFVDQILFPEFKKIKSIILNTSDSKNLRKVISSEERIISPSDFGFHNILISSKGISFLDFEYAGWDDCAKTINDFCCQPERPISLSQHAIFLNELNSFFRINYLEQRVSVLKSLYKLKWCCILLNEFKKEVYDRRVHSGGEISSLLENQLNKVKKYFSINLGIN